MSPPAGPAPPPPFPPQFKALKDAAKRATKPQVGKKEVVVRITPNPSRRLDRNPPQGTWVIHWVTTHWPTGYKDLPDRGTYRKVGDFFLVLEGKT